MIIAIDGESASGKGTLAKLLAKHFNLSYLDTGLLYRALAYLALRDNALDNEELLIKLATNIRHEDFDSYDLRSDNIARIASKVANIIGVRKAFLDFQINFANNPPKGFWGSILDGRDIGSIVCPEANIKFYICASLEERVKRRVKELSIKGDSVSYDQILISLKERDQNDKNRAYGALKKAFGAVEIDNTHLSISETFEIMKKHVDEFIKQQKK